MLAAIFADAAAAAILLMPDADFRCHAASAAISPDAAAIAIFRRRLRHAAITLMLLTPC